MYSRFGKSCPSVLRKILAHSTGVGIELLRTSGRLHFDDRSNEKQLP